MGDSKLCFLLILTTSALAFAQDEDPPACPFAQRFKTLHKYEYKYETESLNAINGASQLKNGPKASCKVEVEVPQTCSFIIHTTGCKLSEVVDTGADGHPVFAPAANSDAFAAEMEKYPLKFVVDREYDVKLYPEDGETTTILNFKRGIISALAVPLLEEDGKTNMPTIHGKCRTHQTVNAREDIATDITLNRDLSRCDKFLPIRDHSSPLALITGMHIPLAQLVRSSQTCNYKFDNEKKHLTSGSCTENHILVPFSNKGQYGVTNIGKQVLTLVQVSAHNDRVFARGDTVKDLNMEVVEDKSAFQDKDAVLKVMRELVTLPEAEGEKRAHLFQTLVSTVRGMKTEVLRAALPEAVQMSRFLTYQFLAQCGTPECSSTIMMIIRTFDVSSIEADAAVFALGLMSNPSALLINDMLEMAKYKPSKPIMYALSNVVKRFYTSEGKLIPEIHSVAEFMASQLGDCTGENDQTFMTLRVVGNMAPAVIPASPALRNAVINCVKQPAASQQVQQAAIQVYRQIPVPSEERSVFMQVLLDNSNSVQERIAAYLILMKDPQTSELNQLASALSSQEDQVKSFIISHIRNIMSSTEPETNELRQKIQDAFQSNEIESTLDPINFSRNYKIGSVQGNMIFEGVSYLPKEVMLEMTLKAFGFEIDMMEVGMEGKGFETTIEALFGENGFFPDTSLKTMYFVSDKMPQAVNEILENVVPGLKRNRMRRQTSQNLMKEIEGNFKKLVEQLKVAESPEAMVYLRLLGNELGYLSTNDFEEMTYSAGKMIENMLKMFPHDILRSLMTNPDNSIFAHYIFMDNEFFLPTMTGVPLRIALSGTFTPGFKGGLQIARDMSTFTFMPSGGIEFVSQIGCHIPEYVNSGLEMHTNIFHESGVTAKFSMGRDNVKLTIPAPTKPTRLIEITNTLVAVAGSEVKTIPPVVMDKVDFKECTGAFAGMKLCSAMQYVNAYSHETAPYFPFTGDSKFAVELHPTGEVTEYTATLAYELQKEGETGQQVDSLKFILRAEGAEATEARLLMNYNKKKHTITADIQIPDYDVEAGIRLGIDDEKTKSKGTRAISLDFMNKHVPQLSLVGRANLKAMKEGMLQVQILVPSVKAESTLTANLKRNEELELESEIKIMDATSEQKIEVKYDGSKIEVEVKSDVNTKTTSLPNGEFIEQYANEILDMRVAQTDMKVRHIFRKFVEAANNYMEKYGAEMLPYMQNFRLPDIPEISLPEKLFLKSEAKAVYHFNNEHFTITIPLLFGGKSTTELFIPPVLTLPSFSLPQFGLDIASREIAIEGFRIPENFTLHLPLFGKVELSTMMTSNLYDVEATLGAGKDVVEPPSYSAKFDLKGTSPIDILSVAVEGTGMVSMKDSIKAHLRSAFTHKLFEAKISIEEEGIITDKINLKSISKIEATSPLGLDMALGHTAVAGISTQEMNAGSNFEGSITVGPLYGKTNSTQSFTISPFKPEAKMDSNIQFDSTIFQAQNTIAATLGNGEFSVVSNINAFEDVLTHAAEISLKDNKLLMKCESNVVAFGMKIRNLGEASAGDGEFIIRMETNGDHSDNRVYSLLTGSLDVNGLSVNCDANVKLLENEATFKVFLKMNKDGLSTRGTTTLHSPLSFENTFEADIGVTGATLITSNKAAMSDMKVDNTNILMITLSSLSFKSKTEASANEYASYYHFITFNLMPYTASASVNNQVKLLDTSFINEAQLKAELYKMDLTGVLKATYDTEEIKHTYQIHYADLSANTKCSTTGKLFGTHMSHNTELEIVGLAAKFTHDSHFNSQSIRFDHTLRWSIVPFDFNLDAIFNGDGDMNMYGKHSAQLYGKFQLRAQPLAFASLHECRASVTQQLDQGFSLETTYDHKLDTVLSPQEQKNSFRIKSKMNEHAFNQIVEVYNTAEKTGIELSGTILTNILNTEDKEFTLSGFLKYDKNTNSHIIHFPLIESLPVLLESVKEFVVHVAEALQDFINDEEMRSKLEALPQNIDKILSQINFEDTLNQLKQLLTDFPQNYNITLDDIEEFLENLKTTLKKLITDFAYSLKWISKGIDDAIFGGTLNEILSQKIKEVTDTIDSITPVISQWIDALIRMIDQTDLEKLKGSSIQFLHDIERQYNIKDKIHLILTDVKETVDRFDAKHFVRDLKETILFFKHIFDEITFTSVHDIPIGLLRDITAYVDKMILELDIVNKTNYVNAKMKELLEQYDVDKKALAVMEKTVNLVKQLKIQESFQGMVQFVKDVDNIFIKFFQAAVRYLRTTDVKDIIDHVNMCIEALVQELKSLKYNDFVDHANQIITEYTALVNAFIRTLEIPEKLKATREFANVILSSIQGSMERMREIKVAELVTFAQDIFENVVCDSLKRFAEYLKEKISKLDIKEELSSFVSDVAMLYKFAFRVPIELTRETFSLVFRNLKELFSDEKIIREIEQSINGFFRELRQMDLLTPSFTIPFTDLIVPSIKLKMYSNNMIHIPPKIDIPQFTILDMYTVKATTISFDDMKQKIIELIDFIVNLEIKLFDADSFFGNLTLNYLPSLPEITLPELTLPEVTFPTIPQLPVENLVKSLEIPEIKLPSIPKEVTVPCFGKLYGEIKFHSPIYTLKMTAAFQNATEDEKTPIFTGYFTSQGTSPGLQILNYTLDTSTRISIPKMKRLIFTETVTFNHVSVGAEHQASVTVYGLSGQGQAKTTIKVNTAPYTANFMNTAFIAVEKGMTAVVDTTYNHVMDNPFIDVSNEVAITQKLTAQQDGFTLIFKAENSGTGKCNDHDFNHISKLELLFSPSVLRSSFANDIVSPILKMRQDITAELRRFSHIDFNLHNKVETPIIKNSLIEAAGFASLREMRIEMKANHAAELYGTDSGVIANAINFKIRPFEFVFEFQTKANARMNIFESLNAKMELQYDYLVNLNPNSQKMSEVFLARLNQYKMFSNLTLDSNGNDASISVEMEGQADLYFLKYPISIPEIELPFIDFRTPAINDLNLYEQTGLQNILTTTEQTFNMDAKMLYQKSKDAPLVDIMDLIHIPSMGKLTTDLSFKSAIFNLNANSLLFAEDDLMLRLGVNTASVFKYLEAKLEGATSLTTMRGIKSATSLSFDNPHIKSTLESTISMSTETFETAVSVASSAKINLPILTLEASQNLIAQTKSKPNALSDLKFTSVFNIPWINAVGKAEAEHSLKLEGISEYISVESSFKSNINGNVFENCQMLGVLDNEANLYLNGNSFRSTSKITADAKLNHGATKILNMDVNNNLAAEASIGRVYAELKHSSNNEANLFSFITQGKHNAQAAFNFQSISSLTSNVEIDLTQQSNFGDITYSEKAVTEVTDSKQKFSTNIKFDSPVYTTNMKAEVEGSAPVLQMTFKSSATAPILILEYDLDAHTSTNLENEHLNMDTKLVFLHSDLSMDVKHVIGQALRSKRQADESVSNHALNVDITSPTFTDVNLRYTANRDAISALVSTPTAGFLALQLDGRNPDEMSARIYGRFLSRSEDDVNILVIRSSKDADTTNLQIVYNLEAPIMMISELKKKIPSIISSFITFADKYQIRRSVVMIKDFASSHINEVYNITASYDVQMSQMSVFFRNTIVKYQKTMQALLDAFVKILRETRFVLPGSNKLTTLPELLKEMTTIAADMLEETIQFIYENMEVYKNYLAQKISNVKVQMPFGDVITGSEIIDQVKITVKEIFDEVLYFVKNMESLDAILEEIGETLKAVVEKTQEFVDSVKSDYLDDMFMKINEIYNRIFTIGVETFDQIPPFSLERFLNLCEAIMVNITEYVYQHFYLFLQQNSDLQAYMVVRDKKLEINLPFDFEY